MARRRQWRGGGHSTAAAVTAEACRQRPAWQLGGSTVAAWRHQRQHRGRKCGNGGSGSLPTARRQGGGGGGGQRVGSGHGRGSRRHRRAATARRRGDDEDTSGDSDGGGTDNNQQSTKISDGNGNGDDDSDDDGRPRGHATYEWYSARASSRRHHRAGQREASWVGLEVRCERGVRGMCDVIPYSHCAIIWVSGFSIPTSA